MDITVKNIKYQLDTEKKIAKVIGCKDNPVDVIIPEFIRYRFIKYKVTEIGDMAFCNCRSLTSITIPDSVTFIGYYAFCDCCSLTSVTIPDSVTSIGRYAFSDCSSLTSVTIPNSVTTIGYGAFLNCSSLTSITIPNSVTSIGEFAFAYCRSLTSITIPDSVTFIGYYAFCDCCSLTSVTIPDSVTSIGRYAFSDCSSLTSVTIPDNVTFIGMFAFCDCCSLTSITIPNNVTYIGDSVFNGIGLTLPKRYTEDGRLIAYKAFNYDMTCRDFQYEEGESYKIKGEIKLCNRGFHACTNLLDVFNYYSGEISKDIVIHEVYLSGDIDEDNNFDSKVCSSKIEIGRRLTMKDINDIIKII